MNDEPTADKSRPSLEDKVSKGLDRIRDAIEDNRTATTAWEEALRAEGVPSGYVLRAEPASHDDARLEALIRRVVREELDRK
jgi:hypothetical protein